MEHLMHLTWPMSSMMLSFSQWCTSRHSQPTCNLSGILSPPPVCCPAWLLRERRPSDKTYQIYSQLLLPRGQTTPMSVPKQKQVKDVHKDLRPISLTPILSKVAEELVIQEHIKAAILKKSHSQYFSCYAKVLTCQSQDGLSWASIGEQSRLTVSQHF